MITIFRRKKNPNNNIYSKRMILFKEYIEKQEKKELDKYNDTIEQMKKKEIENNTNTKLNISNLITSFDLIDVNLEIRKIKFMSQVRFVV